ncbi:MAG: amidohydrolase [Oscillospiraceae bacterium]|nr:amidohydrolase [Oscillospiraceae bacterium]
MKILLKNIYAALPEGASGFPAVRRCDVGVEGDRISFVGEAPMDFLPEKIIDGADRLVIPGLVNAHTHSPMTLLRHRADDLPFMTWLFDNILPMEDNLEPGDCYWGTMLAACEMLRSGTTCFNDMYFFMEDIVRACAGSGVRAVLSQGLLGDSGTDPAGLSRLDTAASDILKYNGAENGRLTFTLAPHAPYTCAPEYIRLIVERARELGVGLHTHISESRDENAQIKEKYNKTPFEYFESAGLFELPVTAAHCVHLTENDIAIAAQYHVSVATNPVSNLKLSNGAAPVKKLLEAGVNVALGTDGAASNNSLNMIRELGYLCLVHKGVNEDAECVPAAQGLHIATMGGAKALGLAGEIGSIEPGKKADLAILNLNHSHFTPRSNLLAALCYGAQGNEVETVLVDGEILLDNGQLTRLDEERIRWEAQRIAERLCNP